MPLTTRPVDVRLAADGEQNSPEDVWPWRPGLTNPMNSNRMGWLMDL
jgi:hypothetical protein